MNGFYASTAIISPSGISSDSPRLSTAAYFDVSPPLRQIAPYIPKGGPEHEVPDDRLIPSRNESNNDSGPDPVAQKLVGPLTMPTPITPSNATAHAKRGN